MKRFLITNKAGFIFEHKGASIGEATANGIPAEWGKPERWVRATDEDITAALETRQVESMPGEFVTEYRLASEYTIEVTDITAEVDAAKAKEKKHKEAEDRFKALDITAKLQSATNVAQLKQALLDILPDLHLMVKK